MLTGRLGVPQCCCCTSREKDQIFLGCCCITIIEAWVLLGFHCIRKLEDPKLLLLRLLLVPLARRWSDMQFEIQSDAPEMQMHLTRIRNWIPNYIYMFLDRTSTSKNQTENYIAKIKQISSSMYLGCKVDWGQFKNHPWTNGTLFAVLSFLDGCR